MMRRLTTIFVMLLFFGMGCRAQSSGDGGGGEAPVQEVSVERPVPPPDSATIRLFREVMDDARTEKLHERPIGERMQALGSRFMNEPYVAGMLDEPDREKLICRLDGFDCVTFVETALALARSVGERAYTYEAFAKHVRDQRYRGGEMDGYCSRLHYFTEWIADNEARGTVKDVTAEIGGEPFEKEYSFMSAHRESYPRFAENDSLYQCIRRMEADLDLKLHYIPQHRIRSVYGQLQAGDIIATATDIEGLDVTHTGLVYDSGDGNKGLLHASTSGGVKISPDLQAYIQGNEVQVGIIVARPIDS